MHYAKHTLDRADHLRKDSKALKQLFEQNNSIFYPVHDGKVLVQLNGSEPTAITTSRPAELQINDAIFLGLEGAAACFAYSYTKIDGSQIEHISNSINEGSDFYDLRAAGPVLDHEAASILAYSLALISWQDSINFCEQCGSELLNINGGHVKKCAAQGCGRLQFPRTDPAVIMLVEHAGEAGSPASCLLGRNQMWPPGMYSTLAGFVEPGETLEHAVSREVFEETRVKTRDVRYVASQPWPFPRSIMLGFAATAETTAITCDPTEIEDARWFTREELRSFGKWGDDGNGPKLPRTDSIAHYLIQQWLSAG